MEQRQYHYHICKGLVLFPPSLTSGDALGNLEVYSPVLALMASTAAMLYSNLDICNHMGKITMNS